MKITSIINYCTYDQSFINKCINSIRPISSQIIVTYTSCFYDGSPENYDLIQSTIISNPDVIFVEIPYEPNKYNEFEWCSYSRKVAFSHISTDVQYVFFLDSDEIIDTNLFTEFVNSSEFDYGSDFQLACYWYFREPIFQALFYEWAGVLMLANNLQIDNVMYADRTSLFELSSNIKHTNVMCKNTPMIHHYSWVRNKEEMLKKVSTWGHKHDRDWKFLVEKEVDHEFSGVDFVHGYQYKILESSFI